MPARPDLRDALLALARADEETRARLASDGTLFEGYHPEMEAVHRANAARLQAILTAHGWPGRALVGEEGAEAAWRIAQHAIGEPAFQRRALLLLQGAINQDEAPAWQAAYLEDRIRACEGRPQRFGTQFDWDEEGRMSPYPPVEDPNGVDARRAAVGLEPLAEATRKHRANVAASDEPCPADPGSSPGQAFAARRREEDAWARSIGWRV
jgi:hypothetical protein